MLLEVKSPLSRPKQELLARLLAHGYALENYVEDYRLHARTRRSAGCSSSHSMISMKPMKLSE